MWATPANVDLKGLCRAHRVPFQQVTALPDLLPALRSAWGLCTPSVVEVMTDRQSNVAVHRSIQAACTAAARLALAGMPPLPRDTVAASVAALERAAAAPSHGGSAVQPPLDSVTIRRLQVQEYELPLTQPLTTAAGDSQLHRIGAVLSLQVVAATGEVFEGTGDVAPLPGLHGESFAEARAQLAALSDLLADCSVPRGAALLAGGLDTWWQGVVGVQTASLHSSVQFAIETALVEALARSSGSSFAQQMLDCVPQHEACGVASERRMVRVNALLDVAKLSAAKAAERAKELQLQGFTCIKVKVWPSADVAAHVRRGPVCILSTHPCDVAGPQAPCADRPVGRAC